jgi:type VI secretion system secreted protein VgrG
MATDYTQQTRYLYLDTPLGQDTLLLAGFQGRESISELYSFQLELQAENRKNIPFEQIMGQRIAFGIEQDERSDKRTFSGIVTRFSQLSRDNEFTYYQADVAPQIWLLTQVVNCRMFQQKTVLEILAAIFQGFTVDFETQGTYSKREYCVQYQETNLAFVSRLMEEEGIFYFFRFGDQGETMVIADKPQSHQDIPGNSKLIFEEAEGGERDDERVFSWEKRQELRSGKYTLWDFNFGVPYKNLEADRTVIDSVSVGKVSHKLKVAGNDKLEIYEYPGIYAKRFDDPNFNGVFDDNKKTAAVRMEQTELPMLRIHGTGNCVQMTAGSRFTLQRHFNADGQYTIVSVGHEAYEGAFRSRRERLVLQNHYTNTFTCIPFALPFRPQRVTPRPRIPGCQTAIVCGPSGEEIYTDKYGRVKVSFHWDRESNADANSSCWIRAATSWAGKQWGAISLPRVGQEVVIDFVDGDPDEPIIVGSVYNAETMPAYTLPDNKTRSGVKSRSTIGGGGFNEIRMEDKKDSEQLFFNAQKDFDFNIGHDSRETIANDSHLTVNHDRFTTIARDDQITIGRNHVHNIATDMNQTVGGKKTTSVSDSLSMKVGSNYIIQTGGNETRSVGGNLSITAGGTIVLNASSGLTLSVGGNFITIDATGVTIVGTMVNINSGGSALSAASGSPVTPLTAVKALLSDTAIPGGATFLTQIGAMTTAQIANMAASGAPTHNANSPDNKKKTAWVEVVLVDDNGKPVAGAAYRVTLPDGSIASGSLDEKGFARIDGIDPGQVKITFPDYDKDAWEPN